MLRNLRSKILKTTGTGVALVALTEVTTHLPSEGRSSEFYHYLSDSIVTPGIRTWLGPEEAHSLAISGIKYGWAPTFRPVKVGASGGGYGGVEGKVVPFARDSTLVFTSPVGVAAGLDKNGVVIQGLLEMGFG